MRNYDVEQVLSVAPCSSGAGKQGMFKMGGKDLPALVRDAQVAAVGPTRRYDAHRELVGASC
jgi:hypothetical protein